MMMQAEMTGDERRAAWLHVSPFLVWVLIMSIPLAEPAPRYALQTFAGAVVLLVARPWRYYSRLSVRLIPLSLLVGSAVFVLWVAPESSLMKRIPGGYEFYMRFAVRGVNVPLEGGSPYDPSQCGWLYSLVRLGGSAFVIAVAEEYFWRGFLLRWMKGRPFTGVDTRSIGWGLLLVGSVLFGLEHSRWLAGILAGIAYGFLYLRTGDLTTAIIAHVTTNALLGVYVLASGAYGFW